MSLTQGTRRALLGSITRAWSVQFYQENDGIVFLGGTPNIDNLLTADCTIEFYALFPRDIGINGVAFTKSNVAGTIGWQVNLIANRPRIIIRFDATDVTADFALTGTIFDGRWHHFAVDWEFATLTARTFTDGVYYTSGTAIGNYDVDAAEDCIVNGRGAIGTSDLDFSIGPIRLSNSRRYAGASFNPPTMNNWPANDANAQLITRMDDAMGATVTDYSGNGYDGTITFGASTRWFNGPV